MCLFDMNKNQIGHSQIKNLKPDKCLSVNFLTVVNMFPVKSHSHKKVSYPLLLVNKILSLPSIFVCNFQNGRIL
jgi:hypothetical protein